MRTEYVISKSRTDVAGATALHHHGSVFCGSPHELDAVEHAENLEVQVHNLLHAHVPPRRCHHEHPPHHLGHFLPLVVGGLETSGVGDERGEFPLRLLAPRLSLARVYFTLHRWAPLLSTIAEKPTFAPHVTSSDGRCPLTKRSHGPPQPRGTHSAASRSPANRRGCQSAGW